MSEAVLQRRRIRDRTLDARLIKADIENSTRRYTDIREYGAKNEKAGTKLCFSGHDGERKVILTVQRKTPGNSVAERVMNAGYGLANEVCIAKMFGLDDAILNHLAVHYDTFITNKGEFVAVSPEIEGTPLIDYAEKCKFDLNAFREFFGDMLRTHLFLKQKGIYHRDNSPWNVLVKKKNNRTQAWTTDLGSACEIETAKAETLQTTGARTVRDPRIKEGQKYSDAQEIYAIAQNMLVALNREPAVKYDSDGIRNFNPEVHDSLIKSAISNLPKWARKRYGELIYRAMASDGAYSTIEDFQKDFLKASKPGLIERLRKETSTKLAVGGLAAVVALATAGIPMLNKRYSKNLEIAVKEASKYVISTDFDGTELELVNNLLDFDISIWSREENPKMLYSEEEKPEYLSLNRGQLLSITTHPQEKPRPKNTGLFAVPNFKGKVYIEGYPAKEFFTDSVVLDPSAYDDFGPNLAYFDFKIPENIPDGNYTLVAELYAHDKPDPPNVETALERIRYEEPGKAISRKRIPIVIGNPRDKLHLKSLRMDYSKYINFENPEKEPSKYNPNLMDNKSIGPNITYEFSIPELGFKESEYVEDHGMQSQYHPKIPIPSPKDSIEKTLQLVVKNNDWILGYTFIPIRGNDIAGDGRIYWWDVCAPGPEFSDKLVKYREEIYRNSDN